MIKNIKHISLLFFLLLVFLQPQKAWAQDDVGYCPDGLQVFVDLSDDPNGVYETTQGYRPDDECCDVPNNYGCIEIIIYLHPDALAFQIEVTTALGSFYYLLNCGDLVDINENIINFCVLEDTEYYSVTFCRPGKPSYEFIVRSFESGTGDVDVDLNIDDPVCLNDDPFELSGGSPEGGEYFINDEPATIFDPAELGPGEHEVSYLYYDEVTGCYGRAEQIVTVVEIPELNCENVLLCQEDDAITLADELDQLPDGGTFFLDGNPIIIFNPEDYPPGDYTLTYQYTDPITDCSNACDFTITVAPLPEVNDIHVELCDYGEDVFINLNSYLLQITTETDVSFAFFTDAALVDEIANPDNFLVQDGDVIYVWVSDDITACGDLATISFTFIEFIVTDHTAVFCSQSELAEEIYDVDLNDYNEIIFPLEPGISYIWYATYPPAEEIEDPIAVVENGDVFFVKIIGAVCQAVAELTFEIHPLPFISCADDALCADANPINLFGLVSPDTGVFTGGDGLIGNEFDPAIAGPGLHEITYEVVDGVTSCENSCVITITVHPLPIANNLNISLCGDPAGVTIDLTIYESALNNQGNVDYMFFDVNGDLIAEPTSVFIEENDVIEVVISNNTTSCENTATITFTIDGIIIDPPPVFELCEDAKGSGSVTDINLEDFQYLIYQGGAGVVFQWFEDADGDFPLDPISNLTIPDDGDTFYVQVTDGACESVVVEVTFVINSLPDIAFIEDLVEMCVDSGVFSLIANVVDYGAYSQPGTFSGTGVSGVNFDPSIAGPGDHEITFFYTDPHTGCSYEDSFIITVHPLPVVQNYILTGLCDTGDGVFFDLTSIENLISSEDFLHFDFYYDSGMTNVVENYANADLTGVTRIYVKITNTVTGCENSARINVEIFTFLLDEDVIEEVFCDESGDGSLTIDVLDLSVYHDEIKSPAAAYTFIWYEDADLLIPIDATQLNDVADGAVFYVEVSDGNCSDVASVSIEVLALPVLEISGDAIVVCQDDESIDLVGYVTPLGGNYTGPGVTNNVFDPQLAGQGVHTFTYTYTDGGGCTSSLSFTIPVSPTELAYCPGDMEICVNEASFVLQGAGPVGDGYEYEGPGVSLVDGDFIFNPEEAGVGVHQITYWFYEDIGGEFCYDECTFEIEVFPLPAIQCPENLTFCNASGWQALPQVDGVLSGEHILFSDEEDAYVFNTDAPPGIYVIEHIYTQGDTGCSNTCSFSVEILPLPQLELTDGLSSFCPVDEWVSLHLVDPQGGEYVFDAGDFIVNNNQFNPAQLAAGTYDLTYIYTDICTSQLELSIEIWESPSVTIDAPSLVSNCEEVQLQGSVSGGLDPYQWQWIPAALVNAPQQPTTSTVPLGGNTLFTLEVSDDNGCVGSADHFMVVENSSNVNLADFDPVCLNDALVELTGGFPAGGEYFINDDVSPSNVFLPSQHGVGEHVISYVYIDLNGCFGTAQETILVRPLPQLQWLGDSFCDYGGWVSLDLALPAGGHYSGAFVQNNQFNLGQAGFGLFSVNYTYTDEHSCSATISGNFEVHDLPIADAGENQLIEVGTSTILEAADGGEGSYTYQWSPAVFLTQPNQQITPTINLIFAQIFNLQVQDLTTGCVNTDQTIVNISGGAVEISYILYPSPICFGETAEIEVVASGGTEPYSYYWYDNAFFNPTDNPGDELNFGETDSSIFIVEPDAAGSFEYYVYVEDVDGNQAQGIAIIEVLPLPQNVDLELESPVCANELYEFSGGFPEGGTYSLRNDSDMHLPIPYNPYPYINLPALGEGNYFVDYTYTEFTDGVGCSATARDDLEIQPYVNAEFFTFVRDRCNNQIVNIINNSEGGDSYTWDFDGGTASDPDETEFTVTYPIPDSESVEYTITIIAEHPQCPHELDRTITVAPQAQALFAEIDGGCAPHTIALNNQSSGEVLQNIWSMGDGRISLEENPEHTFTNFSPQDSIFNVSLTILTQNFYCSDTYSREITVFPQTISGFTLEPTVFCSPHTAEIFDISYHADQYFWSFGNEETLEISIEAMNDLDFLTVDYENLNHLPDTLEILQQIWLERDDEELCSKEFTRQIVVLPHIEARISIQDDWDLTDEGVLEVCAPFTFSFDASESVHAHHYAWDFKDGGTSSFVDGEHVFRNTTADPIDYQVSLKVSSVYGCSDYDEITVRVHPELEAGFTLSPLSGCSPLSVEFLNTSSSASVLEYEWDYPNVEDPAEAQPGSIVFTNTGTEIDSLTIQLEVTNGFCTEVFQKEIAVYPSAEAVIDTDPTPENGLNVIEGCAPFEVDFSALDSRNAVFVHWYMGYDDVSSALHEHTHVFEEPGTYDIELEVSSAFLCPDVTQIQVVVHPTPDARLSFDENEGCSPLQVPFSYVETANLQYTYSFDYLGENDYQEYDPSDLPNAFEYVNTGDAPQNHDLVFQVVSDQGCVDTFEQTITVFPEVTALIQTQPDLETENTPLEVCSGTLVTFDAGNSLNAHTFHWDLGNNTTSSQTQTSFPFINFGHEHQDVYDVGLHAVSVYGCENYASIELVVHPKPLASFSLAPHQGCSPLLVGYENYSIGATNYAWSFGDGEESEELHPEHTFLVDFEEEMTVFESELLVANDFGCQERFSKEVVVYPKLEADFEMNVVEGCHPLTVAFENTSRGNKNLMSYRWSYGDGQSSSVSHDLHQHVFYNTHPTQDQAFVVQLEVFYNDVCYDVIEKEVLVLAKPRANFYVADYDACSPVEIEFVNTSQGREMSMSWDYFGDGTDVAEVSEQSHTYSYYQPAGENEMIITPTLFVESENGCTDTFVDEILIYPAIYSDFDILTLSGCHPLDVEFVNQSQGANSYAWTYGDGTQSFNAEQEHTHTFYNYSHLHEKFFTIDLMAQSKWGCTDSVEKEVSVYPMPMARYRVEPDAGCSPLSVSFYDESQGVSNFIWDFGDEQQSPQENPEHTYEVSHEFQASVFESNLWVENEWGCQNTFEQSIEVYPDLIAGFTANIYEGCHPLEVNLSNTTQGDKQYLKYVWEYGDGNTSTTTEDEHIYTFFNFSHTEDITYTLKLKAYYADSCYDEYEAEVTVLATPLASFSVSDAPGCAPHPVSVHNQSVGASTYVWDYGDGSEPSTVSVSVHEHVYYQPPDEGLGVFELQLEVTANNGCQSSFSQNVSIYPEILAEFEYETTSDCHPKNVQFTSLAQGADYFLWTLGDNAESQQMHPNQTFYNYSHTQSKAVEVDLHVISEFGCEASFSEMLWVRPVPKAKFNLAESSGCSPFNPGFANESIGAEQYVWDFDFEDENSNVVQPDYTWHNTQSEPLVFHPMLTVNNSFGCEDQSSTQITVFPEVTALFTTDDEEFADCSPFEVRFVNQSSLAHTYTWNFDDGNITSAVNPVNIYYNESPEINDYTVSLLAESLYGCTDFVERGIQVFPTPLADFNVFPLEQPYPNTTFTLTNRTNAGDWEFLWDFDDGNTSPTQQEQFAHTYVWDETDLSTQVYTIRLEASNIHCSDAREREVSITSPVPVAAFNANFNGCEPHEVHFINQSQYYRSFLWSFGDGSFSFDENPVYTYYEHGVYEVLLVAIGDGGRDSIARTVQVFENPTALFEILDPLLHIPYEPIQVKNNSLLGSYYLWDFGDGNTSNEFEPQYYYERPGIYDVQLIVYNDTQPQCSDTLLLQNALRAQESCRVIFPNAFTPSAAGSSGGSYNPADASNEVFYPFYEGLATYELEIFNRWGELIYRTTDPLIGWDGYVNGVLMPMGVYVWRLKARCSDGRILNKAGDVTLIR